jgi:hypothetical protein
MERLSIATTVAAATIIAVAIITTTAIAAYGLWLAGLSIEFSDHAGLHAIE